MTVICRVFGSFMLSRFNDSSTGIVTMYCTSSSSAICTDKFMCAIGLPVPAVFLLIPDASENNHIKSRIQKSQLFVSPNQNDMFS